MGRKFDLIFASSAIGACVVIAIGFSCPLQSGPEGPLGLGPAFQVLGRAEDCQPFPGIIKSA